MYTLISRHCRSRLQQRSIPQAAIDLLEEYGSSSRAHGAERLFFDKSAKRRLLENSYGKNAIKSFERYLNIYMVVGDDGVVITAGRRNRRFRQKCGGRTHQ